MPAQPNFTVVNPPAERRRKFVPLAVLLQCVPLLGAAACFHAGAADQNGGGVVLLWFSVLFWGFGYLYLMRWWRFMAIFLLGPIFAFTSCTASFKNVHYDYEHPYQNGPVALESANHASTQTGLIVAGAVLLLAVDAWRLAVVNNAAAKAKDEKERRRLSRARRYSPRGMLPGSDGEVDADERASPAAPAR